MQCGKREKRRFLFAKGGSLKLKRGVCKYGTRPLVRRGRGSTSGQVMHRGR